MEGITEATTDHTSTLPPPQDATPSEQPNRPSSTHLPQTTLSSQLTIRSTRPEVAESARSRPRANLPGAGSDSESSIEEINTSHVAHLPQGGAGNASGIATAAELNAGTIALADLGSAIHELESQPLPPHVNTPQKLLEYITTPTNWAARAQAAIPFGVGTATTFGLFRGLGALAEHSTDKPFLSQLATQGKAMGIGAATGAVGHIIGQTLFVPIASAGLSHLFGGTHELKPIPAHELVPEGSPNQVAQRADVAKKQTQYTIDSFNGIMSGDVSFGGANAAKGAIVAKASLTPGQTLGAGVLTSDVAGMMTSFGLETTKARATTKVTGPDGNEQTVSLFELKTAPPTGPVAAVQKAVTGFVGGHTDTIAEFAGHVASQVLQRGVGIAASTIAVPFAQAGAAGLAEHFEQHGLSKEHANMAAQATVGGLAFLAVVQVWFTLLPKILATQAKRPSAPQ